VFLAAAVTPQPAQAATSSWPPDGSAGPLPAGIEVQPLDVGYASGTVAPSGVARFTLSRLAVAPGGEIPRHQAGGPELLSVEAGALALTVDGGEIAVRTSPTASVETVQSDESAPAAPIRLGANGAALIQPGTISTASNAGDDPLVVLRLTILPA
jgi:hypothetical protein